MTLEIRQVSPDDHRWDDGTRPNKVWDCPTCGRAVYGTPGESRKDIESDPDCIYCRLPTVRA